MGRLSQAFWALQADVMPTVNEAKHHFSHLDLVSKHKRAEMKKLRREFKNERTKEAES